MAFDDLRPRCRVIISGQEMPLDVLNAITSIEVDLSRDLADQIKLQIINPSSDRLTYGYITGDYAFLDTKIWLPGNQIDVYMGYAEPVHVGSGIIQKWLPSFPRDGMPMLEIVALDASTRMMDAETAAEPAVFSDLDIGSIVVDLMKRNDIEPVDVAPVLGDFTGYTTKKAGMTDYQFVKGLANMAGYEFKVFYNVFGKRWEGVWRPAVSEQEKTYTFTYGGGNGTLLSFEPQWGLRDAPSDVKVLYFDSFSKTWQELNSVGISSEVQEEVLGGKKASKKQEDLKLTGLTDRVTQGLESLEAIRIGTGGVSVEIIAERPFPSAEAAERFAARWIKQYRDNFITGQGTLIGLESLQVGDIHKLDGIGMLLSGKWEITTVRHMFKAEGGYTTEFCGNKVIVL